MVFDKRHREHRKPRSSRNRKPYGTAKDLERIFNGESQNDIVSENNKELKENA